MLFTDVTIVFGEVRSIRTQDTATMAPAAIACFRDLLATGAPRFTVPGRREWGHIECVVRRENPNAVADFLVEGVRYTRSALLVAGGPPSWLSATLPSARPLLATVIAPEAAIRPDAMGIVADMETCLAAAFFIA